MTTEAKALGVQLIYQALASQVIAVAVINHPRGDWSAYIGAVPGKRHKDEWQEVVDQGSKLPRHVAEEIFKPSLDVFNAGRAAVAEKLLRWRA